MITRRVRPVALIALSLLIGLPAGLSGEHEGGQGRTGSSSTIKT